MLTQVIEKNWLIAILLPALALTSCAAKSAAVHPVPYFSSTPTRVATNAVDAGDGDLEIAALRDSVTSRPDDVDIRLRLAQAYAAHGFADVALEHLRLAAERFPNSLPAALSLARTLRHAGQKDEALAGLKAFIHAHPQNTAEPYEWLGILNDDLQHWQASQLAYETALLYSPQSAELHNNLGNSLLLQHLHTAAANEFRAALLLQSDSAIARNNLGIALLESPKEAILHWQASSGPAAAHNNMAALLIERGDLSGARKELETALSYDRNNAPAIFNLALVAEKDGRPAVISPQAAAVKTAWQFHFFERFFHPGRHSDPAKPVDTQTVERAVAPTGSGSGN
jgi:Flp pilus assembly protein TadD